MVRHLPDMASERPESAPCPVTGHAIGGHVPALRPPGHFRHRVLSGERSGYACKRTDHTRADLPLRASGFIRERYACHARGSDGVSAPEAGSFRFLVTFASDDGWRRGENRGHRGPPSRAQPAWWRPRGRGVGWPAGEPQVMWRQAAWQPEGRLVEDGALLGHGRPIGLSSTPSFPAPGADPCPARLPAPGPPTPPSPRSLPRPCRGPTR